MRTTKALIEYNKGRIEAIDESIDIARKNRDNRQVHVLQGEAGKIEKRIERLKHLDEMSGNTLMESIRALDAMWDVAKEYDHVREEFADVEKVITDKLNELEKEHDRRCQEEMDEHK